MFKLFLVCFLLFGVTPDVFASAQEIKEEEAQAKEIFCCSRALPYKPRRTDHEDLFKAFSSFASEKPLPLIEGDRRAIQFVKQKSFGPVIEKRYFVLPDFKEISAEDFSESGHKRLNSFKNYKCKTHGLFFEVNGYTAGSEVSHHHKSTVSGSTYKRDDESLDLESVLDKGIWDRFKVSPDPNS